MMMAVVNASTALAPHALLRYKVSPVPAVSLSNPILLRGYRRLATSSVDNGACSLPVINEPVAHRPQCVVRESILVVSFPGKRESLLHSIGAVRIRSVGWGISALVVWCCDGSSSEAEGNEGLYLGAQHRDLSEGQKRSRSKEG